MKKMVLTLGLVVIASSAFAASLSVPWFVDNAPNAVGPIPSGAVGSVAVVYLHNNYDKDVLCRITYYSELGVKQDFASGVSDTFVIPALSTINFRPVAVNDTGTLPQESAAGAAVPDRPTDTAIPGNDGKKNGSLVIEWAVPDDVDPAQGNGMINGIVTQARRDANGFFTWGTLLPTGFSKN